MADADEPNPVPRVFQCDMCARTFPSLQALGGHQNAHRKQRRLARSLENERRLPLVRQAEMERFLLTQWASSSGSNWPAPDPAHFPPPPEAAAAAAAAPDAAEPETELDLSLKL